LKLLITTGMWNLSFDLGAARERGVVVSGTSMLGYPAAEHALALIFALFKKIPQEHRTMHEGGWQGAVSEGMNGKTLGILGLGKLGGGDETTLTGGHEGHGFTLRKWKGTGPAIEIIACRTAPFARAAARLAAAATVADNPLAQKPRADERRHDEKGYKDLGGHATAPLR